MATEAYPNFRDPLMFALVNRFQNATTHLIKPLRVIVWLTNCRPYRRASDTPERPDISEKVGNP